MIVDDASNYTFITEIQLTNTILVQSEFKARGELLPYYYYLKNKIADTVVIVHDSTFIQQYIEFGNEPKFLWDFNHDWDSVNDEINLICKLNNYKPLLDFYYQKDKWYGCFGVMSVMTYTFLQLLEDKYNLSSLINYIKYRPERMLLERVFAVLISYELKIPKENISLFGNIHNALEWGYSYNSYINNKQTAAIVKVWSQR